MEEYSMPDYVNARIWKDTRRLLRLIAAQTDEQMVEVMQRLCENEWERVRPKDNEERQISQANNPNPS